MGEMLILDELSKNYIIMIEWLFFYFPSLFFPFFGQTFLSYNCGKPNYLLTAHFIMKMR